MSQRMVRVSELVKREISDILHTRYRQEAVCFTVTDVDVAPDLRQARVYYSVLGGHAQEAVAEHFFENEKAEIRYELGKRVRLKYLPELRFFQDSSLERGLRITEQLDALREEEGWDEDDLSPPDNRSHE